MQKTEQSRRVRFSIEADVDEDALREHVDRYGDAKYPIVADVSEFAWIDLEAGIELGLVEEVEIVDFEFVEARS